MNEIINSTNNGSFVVYFKSVSNVTSMVLDIDKNEYVNDTYEYSYSLDDNTWNAYESDLNTFLGTLSTITDELYIRIKLLLIHENNSHYRFVDLKINDNIVENNGIEILDFQKDLNNNVNQNKLFRPFNILDDAYNLRSTLCDSYLEHMGEKCNYYRVRPNMESANYSLKTFGDSNVFDKKELNITFKDGTKPDNRPVETEWSSEFDDILEIEILKTEFSRVFGENETPSDKDFLYLQFDKRMYEINTVYEKRDMYNKGIKWNAILLKYEENANINKGTYDDIDDFTKYTDVEYENEYEEETRNSTPYNDDINDFEKDNEITTSRGFIKSKIQSYDDKMKFNPINIKRNDIDFMSYMMYSSSEEMIKYNIPFEETYSIVFWFKLDEISERSLIKLQKDTSNVLEININSFNKLQLKRINNTNEQFQNLTQTEELIKNKLNGVVVNINNTNSSIGLIDEDYNSKGAELFTNNFTIETPNYLTVLGNGLQIGNIRIYKENIDNNDTINTLTTKYPENDKVLLSVNIKPNLKETIKQT